MSAAAAPSDRITLTSANGKFCCRSRFLTEGDDEHEDNFGSDGKP